MKNLARVALMAAAVAVALPASAAWEELRRDDSRRLSIDANSIKRKGNEVSFRYLVDFREKQGDFKTAEYRSLTVAARIDCKGRTIEMGETEVFSGNEAKGPAVGVMKAEGADAKMKPIEAATSDEELYARVCKPASAKAPPKGKAPAEPKK